MSNTLLGQFRYDSNTVAVEFQQSPSRIPSSSVTILEHVQLCSNTSSMKIERNSSRMPTNESGHFEHSRAHRQPSRSKTDRARCGRCRLPTARTRRARGRGGSRVRCLQSKAEKARAVDTTRCPPNNIGHVLGRLCEETACGQLCKVVYMHATPTLVGQFFRNALFLDVTHTLVESYSKGGRRSLRWTTQTYPNIQTSPLRLLGRRDALSISNFIQTTFPEVCVE